MKWKIKRLKNKPGGEVEGVRGIESAVRVGRSEMSDWGSAILESLYVST